MQKKNIHVFLLGWTEIIFLKNIVQVVNLIF